MHLSHLRFITTIFLIYYLAFTGSANTPVLHYPVDDIAVNCGFSGSSSAFDGREWMGDMSSTFTSPKEAKGKPCSIISSTTPHQSLCANHVPYTTAWISRAQFTYTFRLKPGQKFVRLHFYSTSYPGFERSNALFTVKAGPYTLLSNFSTSIAADALGVTYFAKEFCVNIEENQVFNITFFPSKSPCSSTPDDVYAFINGIEIVSMPTGLYYTPDGHFGPRVVANNFFRYYIDNGTALEMVHRLNVGGRSVLPVEDSGMFRMWSNDEHYLLESSLAQASTSNMITYANILTHSAPPKVYQTTWSIGSIHQTNQLYNFTWKLPVDLGFRYLVRLHFCELEHTIAKSSQKQFDLLINKKKVEADADVIRLSGTNGEAVYRDYVVMMRGDRMEGRRDLTIALQLKYASRPEKVDSTVRGIEIFKLSNPDNNLAGVNPVYTTNDVISGTSKTEKIDSTVRGIKLSNPENNLAGVNHVYPANDLISGTLRFLKFDLAFGSVNMIATSIILGLTILSFIYNHLKRLKSILSNGMVLRHNNLKEENFVEVSQSLASAGLESCKLIVGIDFTGSNTVKGSDSFNGLCLHDIEHGLNPYEQAISIIGKSLEDFAADNLIPCFGFGDATTHDEEVFSFNPDNRFCKGFEEVLSRYREIVPHLRLSGPTSFAPMIEMAMTVVEQSGFKFHVLLLIADGEVTTGEDEDQLSPQEQRTIEAIVEASKLPLSIILVGVGDGPFDMTKFRDNIPTRAFNNFQFVNFTEILSKNVAQSQKEKEFALAALTEIPSQYKATKCLWRSNLLPSISTFLTSYLDVLYKREFSGDREGNAPAKRVSVPLSPPVPAAPANAT